MIQWGRLYRVVSGYFVAGFVVESGWVRQTAPILAGLLGLSGSDALVECQRRGWSTQVVAKQPETKGTKERTHER